MPQPLVPELVRLATRRRRAGAMVALISLCPTLLRAQDPTPQPLPELTVTTKANRPAKYAGLTRYDDFFRRRNLGIGTFRTRAEIDSSGAHDITSVLQRIPGVSVSSTGNPHGATEIRFRIARCPGQPPNIAFYVDGHRMALFTQRGANQGSELSTLFRPPPRKDVSSCEDCVKIAEAFASIPFREIELVEFYRGPGQIPPELDRGDACAALVVWTR